MKDFLDRELAVDDSVVIAQNHGKNSGASLVKGVVIGFTNTMIKVNARTHNQFGKDYRLIDPNKVLKI